jgi:glutamyl-tRNA synthetase
MNKNIRVRFAPSPTGPLHIGGVRTALYNYLFAKKHGGTFILRIEDTDQTRYVPGAEDYIIESLNWLGLTPDEGQGIGGPHGPYRQSERKAMYKQYAEQLVAHDQAYYAFDSAEEIDALRAAAGDSFKYGHENRVGLKNSLTLSETETQALITAGENVVIRLKIPKDKTISFVDEVRGAVSFESNELDDKVLLKGDGMPTYHLANIVDDHLMDISHVIRGEEWLPSTAHHILMYEFFGWTPPSFSHLPLILKPVGQGKLSKRDGAKFGFPVFPIDWDGSDGDGAFPGFRETGFLPEALLNFIAFLGWNPGNDEEILSREQLIEYFSLDRIVKAGARFDYDKAKWYNQQYIINTPDEELAIILKSQATDEGIQVSDDRMAKAAGMMKERVHFVNDIIKNGSYLFHYPSIIDQDTFSKKYKPTLKQNFIDLASTILTGESDRAWLEGTTKQYISDQTLKMGDILPILRIALTGTLQGPDLFDTMAYLGNEETHHRIIKLIENA